MSQFGWQAFTMHHSTGVNKPGEENNKQLSVSLGACAKGIRVVMKMNALKNCIALHFMKSSKRNSWDRPALGTGPAKFFVIRPALGTGPLLGQARSWDRPPLGTGPFLGAFYEKLQTHLHHNAW
jgi:hypothetical protein